MKIGQRCFALAMASNESSKRYWMIRGASSLRVGSVPYVVREIWRRIVLSQDSCRMPSAVSHKGQVFRREGFSCPARRERRVPQWRDEERATTWGAKRTAALRVAPRKPRGFVVRPSQNPSGMLRPHASPRGFLGATKHPPFARHDTRRRSGWVSRVGNFDSRLLDLNL